MNTTPAEPAVLLPLAQVARILHVPPAWLRAECEAGRLPHLRADKQILMEFGAVEALLVERARQSLSPEGGDHA